MSKRIAFIGNTPRDLKTYDVFQNGKQIAQVFGENKKAAMFKAAILYGRENGMYVQETKF